MKYRTLDYYICIKCGSSKLSIVEDNQDLDNEELVKANLLCSQCDTLYPVIAGIPRFVSPDNYADSFGYQWNIHRKTQLDSFTGYSITRDRLFGVTNWPKEMKGQRILEAGSGAGRFTEILLETGADLFSFDFSTAVDANWANNRYKSNLNLFQGDIFNIPLRKASFDKVMCLGVIQHTPDPEKAFKSLVEYVRPGGELVIDVYTKSLLSLLHWRFLLRPFTKRMNKEVLYKIISSVVPVLLPFSILLRRIGGSMGTRLLPISEYSDIGLPYELNKQWSILDTFDMYSPAHDHPQSIETVKRWFKEAGFIDVAVNYGINGVVGKGRKAE